MDKAILIVSFGTSHKEAREKNIDKTVNDIKAEYTEYRVYSAFTSYIITKKLRKEGVYVDTVEEAFERIVSDGIKKIVVQPTHIIKGIEYEKLCKIAEKYRQQFDSMIIGEPLLSDESDFIAVARFIESIPFDEEALVLMGHGTKHRANSAYKKLEGYIMRDNIFIGTVEAKPDVTELAEKLKNYKTLRLAPLMIVAGDHALNDMAGDKPDSWKNIFTSKGIGVKILLKGLGEYDVIRKMFSDRIRRAIWKDPFFTE